MHFHLTLHNTIQKCMNTHEQSNQEDMRHHSQCSGKKTSILRGVHTATELIWLLIY